MAELRTPDTRPGTAQAELHAAARERENGLNPHRREREAALAAFHEQDNALQAFKRKNIGARLGEIDPTFDGAEEKIRAAFELLREGCELHAAGVAQVRDVVLDTPGLNGQHYQYDERPGEWLRFAVKALDEGDLDPPGLNAVGQDRLARLDG